MNIVIDPAVSGDELRQQLFAGNLVILTRLQALHDFVEYTREELTELFRPYDPEFVHEHIDPPEMARILSAGSLASSTRTGRRSSSAPSSRRRASRPRTRITTCRSRGRPSRWGT